MLVSVLATKAGVQGREGGEGKLPAPLLRPIAGDIVVQYTVIPRRCNFGPY